MRRPDVFLPDLGKALNNLAKMLSLLNRDANASVIRQEADAVFSLLAKGSQESAGEHDRVLPSDP